MKSNDRKVASRSNTKDTPSSPTPPSNVRKLIEALRYVHRLGKITNEEKNTLIASVVDATTDGKTSVIETMFDSGNLNINDFAAACQVVVRSVRKLY